MIRSPRFWLVFVTLAATAFFWPSESDAFVGFWQLIDFFDWMR